MQCESVQDGQAGVKPDALADLLSQASGKEITADDVASDVSAGAPSLTDGSIPLIGYVRWLVTKVLKGGS